MPQLFIIIRAYTAAWDGLFSFLHKRYIFTCSFIVSLPFFIIGHAGCRCFPRSLPSPHAMLLHAASCHAASCTCQWCNGRHIQQYRQAAAITHGHGGRQGRHEYHASPLPLHLPSSSFSPSLTMLLPW